MGKLLHIKILILRIRFVCLRIMQQTKADWALSHWEIALWRNPLEKFRKRYAVLFGIHSTSYNTKISQCSSVNLKTMQRIRKELDGFNGDYEGTTVWRLIVLIRELPNLFNHVRPWLTTIPVSQPGSYLRIWECLSFLFDR